MATQTQTLSFAIRVKVDEITTYTVRVDAFSWPAPPGSVPAEVTVDAIMHVTPFEEQVSKGERLFKATYLEETLEQAVIVDKDLTILFLFDPLRILSTVIVLPPPSNYAGPPAK